jgi:multidrug efflux system membrane fusion protein
MRKFIRGLIWITLLVIAAVILSPAILSRGTPEKPPNGGSSGNAGGNAGGMAIPVLAAKSLAADVPIYIEGVGTVKALNSVLIRSQVDGTLVKLQFVEGQDVKAGDPIAQIDPRLYQAALDQGIAKKAQDEALLANARVDLDRYIKLVENNSVTKQQADTQRALVAQDEAQVKLDAASIDSSRTTLSYTNITSPIAGRLGLRNVDEGNLIHATDTTGIVTVSQIQPIAVIFNVPQQQLPRINSAKAQGSLSVDAMDDENKNPIDNGTLEVIDNTIDQTTGTVRLKAVFPNPKLELWPGGFVDVRLLVQTLKQAVVIPVAALQRGPKGPFVYVLNGDKVAIRYVTPGQQDDKQAVITSGLKADETIVTTGFAKLTDGATVTAGNDQGAPAPGDPASLHQGTGLPPPRDSGPGDRHQRRNNSNPPNPGQGANAKGANAPGASTQGAATQGTNATQ